MSSPIHQVGLIPFRLPLRRPWFFAGLRITERRGWLVRLEDEQGVCGWGETTPFPEAGTEHPAQAKAWLEAALAGLSGMPPERALEQLPAPAAAPAARHGLEEALLDLVARNNGLPLARLLEDDAAQSVQVNAALGELVSMTQEGLQQAARSGFRCLKLKLGSAPPERELARLELLLEWLPAGIRLRLDANRAWRPEQARHFLERLESRPVELVEEPLAYPDPAALAELRAASPVPLALDESLDHANLEVMLAAGAADLLVLKPMRLGGLLQALEIARRAAESGVRSLVTTTVDGSVASHGAAQLAAAVDSRDSGPAPTLAHGLATGGWLEHDLGPALAIDRSSCTLPREPGLGCTPYPDGARRT